MICHFNLQATIPGHDFYKKVKYETSLSYTKWTSPAWWNKIKPYSLYLGALPLENEGHLEQLVELKITHILTMVEDFELKAGWINHPIQASQWNENGIEVRQIPAIDYVGLTKEEIREGVEYLAQGLEQGHTIYVHCKAGRGRSATIVICYLMQHQNMTLDEAYLYVKEQRPQINLNTNQRQAIINYFLDLNDQLENVIAAEELQEETNEETEENSGYLEQAQTITQEAFTHSLETLLDYVIEGVSYETAEHFPNIISKRLPMVKINSTLSRRNRYLRECQGNQDEAVSVAVARHHGSKEKLKNMLVSVVPFVGTPTSYSIKLWHQLREIALIAAIYGHDVTDPDVKIQIIGSLVTGNVLKIPAQTIDLTAKWILKKILMEMGISYIPGAAIPTHLLFNYFTDNSAKVSTHAIEMFGGERALFIRPENYL